MFTSCRLNTPDGDSDQITFLNGVTRSATTAGSAASLGRFLTGTYASKKQAATVQAQTQCTHRVFLHIWGWQPARAVFKISISILSFAFSRRSCSNPRQIDQVWRSRSPPPSRTRAATFAAGRRGAQLQASWALGFSLNAV